MSHASPSRMASPGQTDHLDEEGHSLTPSYTAYQSYTQPRTWLCCNKLCVWLCCCFYVCEPFKPLFVSFEYVPLVRKVWWLWLALLQVNAIQFHSTTLGICVLSCWGAILLFSFSWAIACRGFHRGLSVWLLAFWIPLDVYIIMRLTGLDHDDFDNSDLHEDAKLWSYAITESITIGLACFWAFLDMWKWLRGRRNVWGHLVLFPRHGGLVISPSLHPHGRARVGVPSPYVHAEQSPWAGGGGSAGQTPSSIGGAMGGSGSGSGSGGGVGVHGGSIGRSFGSSSASSSRAASLDDDSFEWTPRTRTEHLLSRAQEDMMRSAAAATMTTQIQHTHVHTEKDEWQRSAQVRLLEQPPATLPQTNASRSRQGNA